MTHAIRFHKTGGPEVLIWEEVSVGKPGPGRSAHAPDRGRAQLCRHLHPLRHSIRRRCRADLAARRRASSRRSAHGVTDLKAGDRVAYGAAPIGAYAEARVMPADRLRDAARRHQRQDRGGDDAEGDDDAISIRQTYHVKRATPSCSMPQPAASASSPRNGRSLSAPPSSAPSAAKRRRSLRKPMAVSTPSSIRRRTS